MITRKKFAQLKNEGYTHIPLVKVADNFLDPIEAYRRLSNRPYSYLLESANIGGKRQWGRYSIIGIAAQQRIEIHDKQIRMYDNDEQVKSMEKQNPLVWLGQYSTKFCSPHLQDMPRFTGGMVGYFGYETAHYIEPHLGLRSNPDELELPDILLMISDELAVVDNFNNCLYLIVNAKADEANAYGAAEQRLDNLLEQSASSIAPSTIMTTPTPIQASNFVSGFSESEFKAAVDKTKQYIIDGDVMQLVLSQRLQVPFDADTFAYYCVLRQLNPSPYMYYFNFDDFYICGSSPEILVRVEDDDITVRPIAGTRPRGKDKAQDNLLEKDLLSDAKELAEHLMLIDLGRNDIGRVCKIGSVELTEKMTIERYSHVMHIVSNVTGKRRDEISPIDALHATFPAGTVSGAPKVRAMELVQELEPVKRGVYAGAVGYLSRTGTMDTAIAIRTALIKNKTLYAQAGAGIVYDSTPDAEWQETMDKAGALIRAAEIVSMQTDKAGQS